MAMARCDQKQSRQHGGAEQPERKRHTGRGNLCDLDGFPAFAAPRLSHQPRTQSRTGVRTHRGRKRHRIGHGCFSAVCVPPAGLFARRAGCILSLQQRGSHRQAHHGSVAAAASARAGVQSQAYAGDRQWKVGAALCGECAGRPDTGHPCGTMSGTGQGDAGATGKPSARCGHRRGHPGTRSR